ncbi:unnamed protein product [Rotaria magnacalcarata]|uniref:Cap-specific mRNA (nucleoside-2'-O-)-methyltransferase 2 n=6 Tax=Rotaria magnacalcarata TaxID=392030 RepID=A0A814DDR9_9BILA|nr:unnamed protein product [Rotaria magnacalcarata]CAF0952987.1 unnamed protein product [Rotaria magnacalcarata]CAF1636876.1 unnamed protein product [Rotaria magnacalcarata]
MNEYDRPIEESITTRKRHNDNEYSDEAKRRNIESSRTNLRFDFVANNSIGNADVSSLLEKLTTIKQQLNDVKSLLSDKDIIDWNRHTAYMNTASTIVPYLREKLNIEIGTQAWAKMYEILANFDLINDVNKNPRLTTLHLCEAPGAFISALNHFLVTREENRNIEWQWFAQTLNPYYEHDESTVAMLIDDDRIIYHTIDEKRWDFGIDNSGNIMNEENINYYISRFQSMDIHLITADGSFDVQNNPGEQEGLVYPLLKTEVYVALSCLITHGNFILKLFTMFEQVTIDLIHLLYRTFRQISMFKPQTSKKGNSEVYVICIDFNRDKFTNCFSDNLEIRSSPYSSSFLNQLIQCSELLQFNQINTIKHNLHYFENRSKKFNKKLNKLKENVLNQYLDQCQIRELLSSDRHLLKADLQSKYSYQHNNRITRTGTFNNQHQIDIDTIQSQIRNGFFCLICSNNKINDLCHACQLSSQIISDRSLSISHIYIGELIASQQTILDCVYGRKIKAIRNSCFCNRYLLELCSKTDIYTVSSNEKFIDLKSIKKSTAVEISHEQFEQLQRFARDYEINLQCENGVYYVQSAPVLTRLQASIIYMLTRTFEQTSVYVIPSSSSHLLFVFETTQKAISDEYKTVEQEISSSKSSTLLQFVHMYQLLDQHFTFNLIQANNICLQLKYVT